MCNKEIYGYRRIHCLLRKDGIIVSEKIVRRIMNEEQLIVKAARKRKYNSYKGEITPEVDNIIKRDFSAKKPNEKMAYRYNRISYPSRQNLSFPYYRLF